MSSPDGQPSHLLLDLVRTGVHDPPKHAFKHASGSSYHVLSRHEGIVEGKGKSVLVAATVSKGVVDGKVDDTGDDKVNGTGHDSQSSTSRLPIFAPTAIGWAGHIGEDKPFQTAFINPAVGPRAQDVLLSRLRTKREVSPVPGFWRELYSER